MQESTDIYLKHIGLIRQTAGEGSIRLKMMANRDGSPRWIWNAGNPKPDFLRFYAATSLRARTFSLLVRAAFRLRLQHLPFFGKTLHAKRDANHTMAHYTEGNFALFTGTAGPNRKLLLFSKGVFAKISLDVRSALLLHNEALTIEKISTQTNVSIPAIAGKGNGFLMLSDLGNQGKRVGVFNALHAVALQSMQGPFPCLRMPADHSAEFHASLENIAVRQGPSADRIPRFLEEKLLSLGKTLADKDLLFTWAHRDFTSWNCYQTEDRVLVYDFELSHPQMPYGYDAFHFVMQQSILVDRIAWKTIKIRLHRAFKQLNKATGIHTEDFDTCLGAYLLMNTAYYLQVYRKQADWHVQIQWLLNTWNEALSDILGETEAHRPLVIGDVFDFLQQHPYAAIKFPSIHPKELSLYTDIDLLVPKNISLRLTELLQHHPLVQHVQLQRQSHMLSLQVVMHDGGLLAIDLIRQFKRKATVFMDHVRALESAITNAHGIKCLDQHHTQSYLRMFYGLNNSDIPEKYLNVFEGNQVDLQERERLRKEARSLPQNQGMAGLRNSLSYCFDVVRRFFSRKGMIITFSGVDGAGKSTVIEHTRNLLEKKLRRPVVVIRHRPSLLPILSAYTHGKKAAEEKAAATLPRQGSNRSRMSSLLRFTYYFADYLFGQFYVYLQYVMRGKIVLYDRYYFDFINDSVRSNIHLPKWIMKAGYRLLMQPDINFFLYADAKTILQRKKELDEPVIRQLTGDYLQLFRELDARSAGRYIPIENLQLRQTLDIITAKAQAKLLGA